MARCGCANPESTTGTCACALTAGDNVTVTGTGQGADPWVVTAVTDPAEVRGLFSAGQGATYVNTTGVISARLSTDAGNSLSFGTDGGLFAPVSPLGMIVYTTVGTDTWTKAANPLAKKLRVRVVGGGGGSASTGTTLAGQGVARGGGSGGTYSESWLDVATLPSSVTVTVGAGGIAGSPAGTATAGGVGGESSFGTFVTGPGGLGSSGTTAPGAPPILSAGAAEPAAGTGQVSIRGTAGASGLWTSAAAGGRLGGAGGGSGGGMSADGYTNVFTGFGTPGKLYGGGASGSVQDGATAGQAGTAGAQGIVIVEMFG